MTQGGRVRLEGLLEQMAAREEAAPQRPSELVRCARTLAAKKELGTLRTPTDDRTVAALRTVARRLIRQHRHGPAMELLDLLLAAWRPPRTSGLQALRAHAALSDAAPDQAGPDQADPTPDVQAVLTHVRDALDGADRAVEAEDLTLAAELVAIGTGLLLHPALHVDSPTSPLADDPDSFLAPLRSSRAMHLLRSPARTAGHTAYPSDGGSEPGARRRVVLLTGPYPRFAASWAELLRARPDVELTVLDLTARSGAYRWLAPDPELIRIRLAAAHDPDPGTWIGPDSAYALPPEDLEALREADVVVADWADRGAVVASLLAGPRARIVLRVHGADAVSVWLHALDRSRLTRVLTVSPHHASLVDAVLSASDPSSAIRSQVVPHLSHLARAADPPPRQNRTIGLIGWGRQVKDPLWALEVLACLRRRGGPWRLRLVGDDLLPPGRYADRFRSRLEAPELAGSVDLVKHTDDVAGEVARLGFVLSSSVRESFHLGLLEGVLGGAVPVVRDWPWYAAHGGAAALFPSDWVVGTPEEAAERIWSLRAEGERARAAAAARTTVDGLVDPRSTAEHLLAAVLSEETGPGW